MSRTRINLDDFPNSPYARELRREGSELRFEPALESEYIKSHLQRVQMRVRILFLLNVFVGVLTAISEIARGVPWSREIVSLLIFQPPVIILAAVSVSRSYERLYVPVSRICVPLFCVATGWLTVSSMSQGRPQDLAIMSFVLFAVYFITGLLYRHTLIATLAALGSFAVGVYTLGLPHAVLFNAAGLMVMAFMIGYIARDIERSYRKNFLEEALIGELVARDGLSGLMNRRAFDEHLLRIWQQALRDQRMVALMMIDIDHFKLYNDSCGHQAGDEALRRVAQVVQGFARRPLDMAARYGGEEFAMILYDLPTEFVHETAERIRNLVQGLRCNPGASEQTTRTVTVSVGVSCITPMLDRTPQGAIQLADEALYEAKDAGRNRVVLKGADEYRLLDTGRFKAAR